MNNINLSQLHPNLQLYIEGLSAADHPLLKFRTAEKRTQIIHALSLEALALSQSGGMKCAYDIGFHQLNGHWCHETQERRVSQITSNALRDDEIDRLCELAEQYEALLVSKYPEMSTEEIAIALDIVLWQKVFKRLDASTDTEYLQAYEAVETLFHAEYRERALEPLRAILKATGRLDFTLSYPFHLKRTLFSIVPILLSSIKEAQLDALFTPLDVFRMLALVQSHPLSHCEELLEKTVKEMELPEFGALHTSKPEDYELRKKQYQDFALYLFTQPDFRKALENDLQQGTRTVFQRLPPSLTLWEMSEKQLKSEVSKLFIAYLFIKELSINNDQYDEQKCAGLLQSPQGERFFGKMVHLPVLSYQDCPLIWKESEGELQRESLQSFLIDQLSTISTALQEKGLKNDFYQQSCICAEILERFYASKGIKMDKHHLYPKEYPQNASQAAEVLLQKIYDTLPVDDLLQELQKSDASTFTALCHEITTALIVPQPLTETAESSREVLKLQEEQKVAFATGAAQAIKVSTHEQSAQTPENFQNATQNMRTQLNESAVQEFFYAMQQDREITLQVCRTFTTNWEGDKSLFGQDIALGSTLFNEARRELLLNEARTLSKKQELQAALFEFKGRLKKDVEQGRLVVNPKMIAQRYTTFFKLNKKAAVHFSPDELKQWKRDYQRIVGDALLMHELKHEQNLNQIAGTHVERSVLRAWGLATLDDQKTREKLNQAELEVLKVLLQGEGLEAKSIEAMQGELSKAKLRARLEAAGIPPAQVEVYTVLIEESSALYSEMQKTAAPHKERIDAIPSTFPVKAKQLLLGWKAQQIDRELEKRLNDLIFSQVSALKTGQAMNMAQLRSTVQRTKQQILESIADKKAFAHIDRTYSKHIAFYSKWGNRLVREMIQGLDDVNEIFDKGVCLAIALRWIVNEQKHLSINAREFKVSANDRFKQLLHTASVALTSAKRAISSLFKSQAQKNEERMHILIPETLRKQAGIRASTSLKYWDQNTSNPQMLRSFLNGVNTKDYQGTMLNILHLSTGGHAIYIRFQPENGIFRIGDPNVGLFELQNENEFFSCWRDLIETLYSNIHHVEAVRIDPK